MSIFLNSNEKDNEIFGTTFNSDLEHLMAILKRSDETNLVLNLKKCQFMVTSDIA